MPLDLSTGAARQLTVGDEPDILGQLVAGDLAAAERDDLLGGQRPIARHHENDGHLAPARIRPPHHHGIGNQRRGQQDALDRQTSVVYLDRGLSGGMKFGIEKALKDGKKIILRRLPTEALAALGIPSVPVDQAVLGNLGLTDPLMVDRAA